MSLSGKTPGYTDALFESEGAVCPLPLAWLGDRDLRAYGLYGSTGSPALSHAWMPPSTLYTWP